MKCILTDRINNKQICETQVIEFRGRTLTVSIAQSDLASIQQKMLTGELEDESFRGEVEITKVGRDTVVFKVAKAGIYDRRRYLRVQAKQRAKIFLDGHDDMAILTEVAYMSCRVAYCGRILAVGERVVLKIDTGNGEIKVDGDIMQYCGSVGHGALESQIYIVSFEKYNMESVDGDLLYSYILRLANGDM